VLRGVQEARAARAHASSAASAAGAAAHGAAPSGPPPPPASAPYLGPMHKVVFGAVYEHTVGGPVYWGCWAFRIAGSRVAGV